MWRIILLLYFVTDSHQLSITEFTVPSAVESGEDVSLHCRYELLADESDKALFVKWWYTPLNGTSDQRSQLYQRIAGHEPVAIHNDVSIGNDDSILLLNVTPSDSGTYECEVSNIDEVRRHEDLIVYTMGSGPELNVSVVEDGPDEDEDEDVVVSCAASGVAPYPDLVIKVNGEDISSEESVSAADDGTFDISDTASLGKAQADGADVTCELFYRDANITHQPYIDAMTFYVDQTALTTEPSEDATTEATTDHLPYTRDAGFGPASCILLVISALTFSLLAAN